MSGLTALMHLYLNDNSLNGPISSELGGLIALVNLEMPNNLLTGTLPSELGRLGPLEDLCAQARRETLTIYWYDT